MRKQQQMLSMTYSRKNLKKNSFLLIFLFLISHSVFSIEVNCTLENNKSLFCSIVAPDVKKRGIIKSMEIGHRAEIEYRIKIYRKEHKLLNLFGDKLVRDLSFSYIAKKDPFNEKYYIISEKEGKQEFTSEKEFLEKFYNLDRMKISLSSEKKGDYYAIGRVDLKVIKLIPPLNLFSFIIPGIVESSEWIKADRFRIE